MHADVETQTCGLKMGIIKFLKNRNKNEDLVKPSTNPAREGDRPAYITGNTKEENSTYDYIKYNLDDNLEGRSSSLMGLELGGSQPVRSVLREENSEKDDMFNSIIRGIMVPVTPKDLKPVNTGNLESTKPIKYQVHVSDIKSPVVTYGHVGGTSKPSPGPKKETTHKPPPEPPGSKSSILKNGEVPSKKNIRYNRYLRMNPSAAAAIQSKRDQELEAIIKKVNNNPESARPLIEALKGQNQEEDDTDSNFESNSSDEEMDFGIPGHYNPNKVIEDNTPLGTYYDQAEVIEINQSRLYVNPHPPPLYLSRVVQNALPQKPQNHPPSAYWRQPPGAQAYSSSPYQSRIPSSTQNINQNWVNSRASSKFRSDLYSSPVTPLVLTPPDQKTRNSKGSQNSPNSIGHAKNLCPPNAASARSAPGRSTTAQNHSLHSPLNSEESDDYEDSDDDDKTRNRSDPSQYHFPVIHQDPRAAIMPHQSPLSQRPMPYPQHHIPLVQRTPAFSASNLPLHSSIPPNGLIHPYSQSFRGMNYPPYRDQLHQPSRVNNGAGIPSAFHKQPHFYPAALQNPAFARHS